MAGPKPFSSTAAVEVTAETSTEKVPLTVFERITLIRRQFLEDRNAKNARAETSAKAKEMKEAQQEEAHQAAEQAKIKANTIRDKAAKQDTENARIEAHRIAKEKADAARIEAEGHAKQKQEADCFEIERAARFKAEAAAKEEAERLAKEKAQAARKKAERIAKERVEAERLAKEKAAAEAKAKVELQKVIDATEADCKILSTKIDNVKDTCTKYQEKSVQELEDAKQLLVDVEKDREENALLLREAMAAVEQAQTVVDNLNNKASNLEDALTETKKIFDDVQCGIAEMQKDSKTQLAALETEKNEMVKKLEQLVKQFAVLKISGDDVKLVEKASDYSFAQFFVSSTNVIPG